jgi:hypothetical protein
MSLRRFLTDWLGDVLSFDSRLSRSLAPLVAKPGFLTQEYLAGRRARYVPPLRLFVFFSLVMFLAIGLTGGAKINFSLTTADHQVVAYGDKAVEAGGGKSPEPAPGAPSDAGSRLDAADINRRLVERLPQAMFVLAPVFAAFVWLSHRLRPRFYLPHLIFSLHVHCFVFLLATVATLVNLALPPRFEVTGLLVLVAIGPYLYLAQRRVYGGGRVVNVVRTALLAVSQLVALNVVLLGLLWLTVILA